MEKKTSFQSKIIDFKSRKLKSRKYKPPQVLELYDPKEAVSWSDLMAMDDLQREREINRLKAWLDEPQHERRARLFKMKAANGPATKILKFPEKKN